MLLIFIFAHLCVFNSFAQTGPQNDLGTEVKSLAGISGKHLNCFPTNNLVVTKQEFAKLLNDERCSVLKSFDVDFAKHTLINFSVGGDCRMRVTQKLFRNDKTKTYTVEVKNYWGRCRAGGSYHSWSVIEKIPTDYKVELNEIQLDKREDDSFVSTMTPNTLLQRPSSIEFIESGQTDLKGCIPIYSQKQFIIKDRETYLKNIRNDAQTPQCKTNVENLDFEKYSLLGIQINSGYCRYPKGLQHELLKDTSEKRYVLTVSYTDPGEEVCRALSRYDLWLQVPKLQDEYEIVFKIEPKHRRSKN